MKKTASLSAFVLAVSLCALPLAQSDGPQQDITKVHQTEVNETKVHEPDRNRGAVTAGYQPITRADIDLLVKIRRAIIADKTLSMYAHNVKVVNRDGTVILKGPVRSEPEKAAVEAKAIEAANGAKVVSELSVAPSGQGHSS